MHVIGKDSDVFSREIIDTLVDERYFCKHTFLEISKDILLQRSFQILTPHFLTHFDITGLNDYMAMMNMVRYKSMLLGFPVRQSSAFCDITRDLYGWCDSPFFKAVCEVGSWEYYRTVGRQEQNDDEILGKRTALVKEDPEDHVDSEDESQLDPYIPVCPFFVKYTRYDKNDDKSEYRLDSYMPFHSHDLDIDITIPL